MAIAQVSGIRKAGKWKQQLLLIYFSLKDPRTPFYSKIPALLGVVYLLSPIDLIPDFIPVAGWLDDLIIVPFLFSISTKLIPANVIEASQAKASRYGRKIDIALWLMLLIFILIIVVLIFFLRKIFA